MNDLQNAADYLISQLKEKGFELQRYDAKPKSIYIKLDYGASKSIRISDHEGYEYLSYRYNVRSDIGKGYSRIQKKRNRKCLRKYYALSELDKLLEDICSYKERLIEEDGAKAYRALMEKLKRNVGSAEGFHSKSKIIK